MRIVRAVQVSMFAFVLCGMLVTTARADQWDKKTIITFNDAVEIPGQVLPPGTYVFKLANFVADRHVVQIWNENESQLLATILAIPDYRMEPADKTIIELEERPGDEPMAIHSWFYPGDVNGQHFVYHETH